MGAQKITYLNPVWNGYLADPFILTHNGEYWAYGTSDRQGNGRWFPVLHSTDLAHWEYLGGALEPVRNRFAAAPRANDEPRHDYRVDHEPKSCVHKQGASQRCSILPRPRTPET